MRPTVQHFFITTALRRLSAPAILIALIAPGQVQAQPALSPEQAPVDVTDDSTEGDIIDNQEFTLEDPTQAPPDQALPESSVKVPEVPGVELRQKPAPPDGKVPVDAIRGGTDVDGMPLYLCSGIFKNGIYPGKLRTGNCRIGVGRKEVVISPPSFVILTNPSKTRFKWVRIGQGTPRPNNTVATGQAKGLPQYVCRINPYIKQGFSNSIQPGRDSGLTTNPSLGGGCIIGFGGRKIRATNYEVLTVEK
jgi:Protein of unknown function (DUF3421)